MPLIIRSIVVLPAPFRPSSPVMDPFRIEKDTPSTARTLPKVFEISCTLRTSVMNSSSVLQWRRTGDNKTEPPTRKEWQFPPRSRRGGKLTNMRVARIGFEHLAPLRHMRVLSVGQVSLQSRGHLLFHIRVLSGLREVVETAAILTDVV